MKWILGFILALNLQLTYSKNKGPTFVDQSWKNSSIWKPVQKLIAEQKFKAAKDYLVKNETDFKKDEKNWTIWLIQVQRLTMALGQAENSVEKFKKSKWPNSLNAQIILNLYYAQSLLNYYQTYSWEINKREQVASKNKLDLKKWSKEDIFFEIQKSLNLIWKKRSEMGSTSGSIFNSFISKGSFPENIRGTLRDTFSYFYVSFLENTQFWSVAQNNDKQLLNLEKLVSKSEETSLLGDQHPLEKINTILTDLESWHWKNDRVGALLEARLQKIRVLKQSFTSDDQKQYMADQLKRFLRDYKINSWWSEGTYLRAMLISEKSAPDALINALEVASKSIQAYPESIGGKRAKALVSQIKQPSLNLNNLKWDSKNRNSLEIIYKNWKKVYFRAFSFDPRKWFLGKKRNPLPDFRETLKIIEGKKSLKNWSVDLPNPGDYRTHRKLEIPPLDKKGFYIIQLSANEDFSNSKNLNAVTFLNITDLHPVIKSEEKGSRLKVFDAKNGKAESKVKVTLYEQDWEDGIEKEEEGLTDKKGELLLTKSWINFDRYAKFYTLEKGEDFLLNENQFRVYPYQNNSAKYDRALVFTDRSIYRPGQKIQFKVLAYTDRSAQFELPKPMQEKTILVRLYDGNGEELDKKSLTSNKFGTVAGEFEIPQGRFLGNWRIETSPSGGAQIKVEEYKRPTFLVNLEDATGELRLNRKASFQGSVKYYFGLPVKEGRVKYLVKRSKNYPYWYWWWYPRQNESPQIVEQGEVKTDDKGEFIVSFTPRANEAEKDLTFTYSVEVEVLNEGGETAKASRNYQIGRVSVTADLTHPTILFPGSQELGLQIKRQDLNGKSLSGKAKLKLLRLKQPSQTLSPSEQALFYGENTPTNFKTKDDLKRPRWQPLIDNAAILKSWEVGETEKTLSIEHDNKGQYETAFEKLKPGAYRLVYETKDKNGGVFKAQSEFLVLEKKKKLSLPLLFEIDHETAMIGDVITIALKSGFPKQKIYFELFIKNKRIMNEVYTGEKYIKYKVAKRDLGGISARVYTVIDHQYVSQIKTISVPFVSKDLDLSWERIRKKIYPGSEQTWRLKVKSKNAKGDTETLREAAEVLTYMYDRSLDSFTSHFTGQLGAKPSVRAHPDFYSQNQMQSARYNSSSWYYYFYGQELSMDRLSVFDSWSIGGFGRWRYVGAPNVKVSSRVFKAKGMMKKEARGAVMDDAVMESASFGDNEQSFSLAQAPGESNEEDKADNNQASQTQPPKEQARTNFSETAFFKPQLLSKKKGEVEVEFKVPDNLTSYNVWAIASTQSLDFGSLNTSVEATKDLMVRTYLPRFVRSGDQVKLKVVVDNASSQNIKGDLSFSIKDPESGKDLAESFKLDTSFSKGKTLGLKAGTSTSFIVSLKVPFNRLGEVEVKASAKTKNFADTEVKRFPILPSRIHLAQSRFVSLKNKEKREVVFKDMIKKDESLIHDSLVVKLDAQLFYSVLSALPYIVDYPYECSEQTVNKYVTTAILSNTYKDFPSIAKMAQKMSERDSQFEKLNQDDPNRKMGLEETPWLKEAKGEGADSSDLINMLKPRMVKYQKDVSLQKLLKLQYKDGGFTWFAGGRPSFYMTKYVLYSFAKAAEFGVEVPKSNIKKAFTYTKREFDRQIKWCYSHDACFEWITYLNFIMSSYPDETFYSHAFSQAQRMEMLNHSFRHWKKHQPLLKGMLALTLERMDRHDDAVLVLDSVLDSAKEDKDLGVYWAPEDRSWLWYNDTIETHSFALRTLLEVKPKDQKKHGLVQWLFLNKKLNHWKTTRATAEVMYSLLHYLKKENLIGTKERAKIKIGSIEREFNFEPDEYKGKDNFVVVSGAEIKPEKMHKIQIEQKTKGFMFASATWHYSTEKLPDEARGDFFSIERRYFKRVTKNKKKVLIPLKEGAKVEVGDQLEVQISIRSKHAAEYVHLRDPRPAGFEPESVVSGYKWDLGLIRFEEVRDSGMNFFFENLPVGEYTLKHRLRANIAGKFRTHPATLQSVYAPEFVGFSSGELIEVK